MKINKKNIYMVISIFFCAILIFFPINTYGSIADELGDMSGVTEGGHTIDGLNSLIGAFQVAGTGIAIISVSMVGIRYLLASPSGRAELTKQVVPILIGSALLFGTTNLIKIVATAASALNSAT